MKYPSANPSLRQISPHNHQHESNLSSEISILVRVDFGEQENFPSWFNNLSLVQLSVNKSCNHGSQRCGCSKTGKFRSG